MKRENVSLTVTNKTLEDRKFKLFDCHELFSQLKDDGVEIVSSFNSISYERILSLLLSSKNKIICNKIIIINDESVKFEDKNMVLIYTFARTNGEVSQTPILLTKDAGGWMRTPEEFSQFTIENGSYIEYVAKPNTKVNILFLNNDNENSI